MKQTLLKYKSYQGTVEIDLDEGHLYGEVQFINDVIGYHGDTPPELEAAFIEAVDDYLNDCAELNKLPNRTLSGSFNVRIGGDNHKALAVKSLETGQSINELIKRAIVDSLADRAQETHIHYTFQRTVQAPFDAAPGGFQLQPPSTCKARRH
ncbi:type II toxin-antitoxin system HicB family antitoxin [SAR92 clade bacterium H246]